MFKLKKKEARRTDIPCFSRGNIWEGKEVGSSQKYCSFWDPSRPQQLCCPSDTSLFSHPLVLRNGKASHSSGFIPIFWKAKLSKITYTTRMRLLLS